jgi:hypothetical protein
MIIVLISCVGKKKSFRCAAKDLYDSTWFRYAWSYAESLYPDKVFILSAKYGLLDPEAQIDAYQETLNTKRDKEIQLWAAGVLKTLEQKTQLKTDKFIILAGEKYRRHLIEFLPNHEIPMKGLRIGEQNAWLKKRVFK